MPLTTDGSHQNERRMVRYQRQQLGLRHIAGDQLPILHHIYAKQRAIQSQVGGQPVKGRPRAEDIAHAGLPLFRQPVGQLQQHQLLRFHTTLLHPLHEVALHRYRQLPVPARGHPPVTQRRFVQVTHFATGQAHQAALYQAPGQLPSGAGADGVDTGLDLHPGGDAQNRLACSRHVPHVTRRPVTTGEEDQRDARVLHRLHRTAGIASHARPLQRAQQAMTKAHLRQ